MKYVFIMLILFIYPLRIVDVHRVWLGHACLPSLMSCDLTEIETLFAEHVSLGQSLKYPVCLLILLLGIPLGRPS